MTADPRRVKELFVAVLDLPDAQARQAFLERECGSDADLRQRLQALLKAHDDPASALDRPLAVVGPATADYHGPAEDVGTIIAGRYKLLEQIGEGGMGTVWVAEQTQPVRRKVALKLIKAGMDSKNVLSRFEAERQALALMDHPNIAKVLDGGTTENSRPFFVMEYVKGVPFTRYCDDARLSIAERLALFVPICHAVQHAHQKGIIHRDLKPSNLLICLYDGKPVPKVIDFGLAKAMHQPLTEHTLHTAHGAMMGTPLYMSPEQAEFNNLDVDTRTDIYALGVILYELLTGTTPLEKQRFQKAAWQEILRLIKEEEPPRPSARLSGSGSLPSLAAQRQLEPIRLPKLVRGELDWIVMKCLEKDRSRRYDTATGLARDLEHYLHDEPVLACPPSAGYRLKKFARRHKKAVATANAFLVLVLLGTLISAWQAIRAREAEREARKAQAEANLDRDRAQKAEAQANADRNKAEDASKHFQQLDCYHNGLLATQTGDYDSAEKLFVLGLRLARTRRGLGDVETQMIVWALADLYAQRKRAEKGESLLRELLDFQKEHGQADSLPLPYATTLEFLGRNLLQQRQWTAAEALFRDCLSLRENKEPQMMANRFSTKSLLGASLIGQKKYAEAEPYLLQGYQGLRDAAKNYAMFVGRVPVPEAAERLVQLYEATGKKDKAEEWRKKLQEAKDAAKKP